MSVGPQIELPTLSDFCYVFCILCLPKLHVVLELVPLPHMKTYAA